MRFTNLFVVLNHVLNCSVAPFVINSCFKIEIIWAQPLLVAAKKDRAWQGFVKEIPHSNIASTT